MLRTIVGLICSVFCYLQILGNGNLPVGARSSALAHASVTLTDVWATHHNQGALGFIKTPQISGYYENRFFTRALNLQGFAGVVPISKGTFGLSFQNFGNHLFSESKLGIGYGMQLAEFISAGVQISYLNSRFTQNYGNKNMLTAEFGILAKINENISIGTHIYNPFRTKVSNYADERIPSILRIGMDYKITDGLILLLEAQKDIDHDLSIKFGIEYKPNDILYFRGGISNNPVNTAFGFGIELKNIRFDLASSWHYYLGFSPQAGLSYVFDKKKNRNLQP